MSKKILLILLSVFIVSCEQYTDKKEIIAEASNDNLTTKSVTVIQESNLKDVILDIEKTVSSSIEAWKNAPELNRPNRPNSIDQVSKKFLKKLNAAPYLDDDKVIAYRFIKTNQSKKYLGYAVILFHNNDQTTLYYEINEMPYNYYPLGIKQLINKGLLAEINKIEEEYYKKHPIKP